MADDSVTLYVFGIKSIVPEPITAVANLESTWYEFLNNDCGVQVCPKDMVMACTTSYSVPAKRGWSADLSEKIRIFVERFSIKKNKYSVRLMMQLPSPATSDEENQITEVNDKQNQRRKKSADRQTSERSAVKRPYAKMNESESVTHSSGNGVKKRQRPSLSIERQIYRNGQISVEQVVEDDRLVNENEEDSSQEISIEEGGESNNLPRETPIRFRNDRRHSRRPKNDLKPIVKERFARFSNAFLLLVSEEISKLQQSVITDRSGIKRNGILWDRNVQHLPLASYLLQELFMDDV